MVTSLKARHAARYAALARLLLEHWDAARKGTRAVTEGGLVADQTDEDTSLGEDAGRLVDELVAMGPTFVKFGQLLSTRSDLLPPAYVSALSRLRDDVEPLEPGVAQRVVEEELGIRLSVAFTSFEPEPIGSASLGQVHRATLRDGRPVAVKVQRPDVRRQVLEDMEVIGELAEFVDHRSETAARFGFSAMVEQFRRSIFAELDYSREAANLKLLGEILAESDRLVVPQPVDDYTTPRVLTMDYVPGRSVADLTPLRRSELDGKALADQLMGGYLDQVLVHGYFHADPHPGNILLTPDDRLGLVDLGMVARLAPETQEQLLRLLLAVASSDSESAVDALEHLGEPLDDYDRQAMRSRVASLLLRHGESTLGELGAGRVFGELAMASSACGLRPGAELTMLGKALLNLDEVARTLDPDVRIDEIVESHASAVMRHRMVEAARPARVMRSALDAAAFAERLPGHLNKVLESLSEGRLSLHLEDLNEASVIRGAQKMANRVTAGVMIAAFVVTAALFSSAGQATTLWGYPVLTIVFLGLAVVTAAVVGVGILRRDLPQRHSGRE